MQAPVYIYFQYTSVCSTLKIFWNRLNNLLLCLFVNSSWYSLRILEMFGWKLHNSYFKQLQLSLFSRNQPTSVTHFLVFRQAFYLEACEVYPLASFLPVSVFLRHVHHLQQVFLASHTLKVSHELALDKKFFAHLIGGCWGREQLSANQPPIIDIGY